MMPESPQALKAGHTRRSLRLPFRLGVEATCRNSSEQPRRVGGMVQNLGAGGLMIELPVPVGPGGSIDLETRTKTGEAFSLPVIVVWNRSHHDIFQHGVRFRQVWGSEAVDRLFRSRFEGPG